MIARVRRLSFAGSQWPVVVAQRLLVIGMTTCALALGLALARLPLVYAAAALVGGAALAAMLIEPLFGLSLTLIVAPLAAYTNFMTGAALRPLDVGQVVLALMLGAWLLRGLARREICLTLAPLAWLWLVFVGWAALSLLWASSFEYAIPQVIKWVQVILVMLIVAQAGRRGLIWALVGALASGAFQAALGLWQFGLRGIGPETFNISGNFYRAYGSFEQPNPYAGYLGLIWPVAAGLVISNFRFQVSNSKSFTFHVSRFTLHLSYSIFYLLPCSLLLVAGLVASWSRGAWLGAAAAAAVMAAAFPRRTWLGLGAAGAAAAILISASVVGLLPGAIRARLTDFTQYTQVYDVRGVGVNDANYAVIERLAHWQAAGEMIRYQPWTGVGLSNYEPVYARYALMNWPRALGHAHNYYLNVAAELGAPGLSIYLLAWGAVLWQTWRALRHSSGWRRGLALGLLGAWTHLSVHHLFDNLYVNNTHLLIGAWLGVLAVLTKVEDE